MSSTVLFFRKHGGPSRPSPPNSRELMRYRLLLCSMKYRESLENVVMPVQWIMEFGERVNRPTNLRMKSLGLTFFASSTGTEDAMLQKELRSLLHRLASSIGSGSMIILDQSPEGRQALVERGVPRLLPTVTIPSPIRPLPHHQRLCEPSNTRVFSDS